MMRTAYELRPDDDDWSQAGALVREVMDDEQRERFVQNVAGHLLGGVQGDVLERAFGYWKNVDTDTGGQIKELVRKGLGEQSPRGEDVARAEAERGVIRESSVEPAH